VAQINVGASTEAEMKEKKARVEDALHATRTAVEEGVLPGDGVALFRSLEAIKDLKGDYDDKSIGIDIIRRSLVYPIKQIAKNAGQDGSIVCEKLRSSTKSTGYALGNYLGFATAYLLAP